MPSARVIEDMLRDGMENGHDGSIIRGWSDGSGPIQYVAFNPAQIKSATGNTGDFDGTNPDIRYSLARNALPGAAQRKVQDKLNRFTVIKEWLAENGVTPSEQADIHKAEERMHSRFANKAQDFREKRVMPLVQKVQKAGFTMEEVAQFLHANHAQARNAQIAKVNPQKPDGGSGMTNADHSMTTLSLTAAAERMCVHVNTVLKLITAGAIPAAKIGRAWVMLESDVMNYIEQQVIRQTAERRGVPLLPQTHQRRSTRLDARRLK